MTDRSVGGWNLFDTCPVKYGAIFVFQKLFHGGNNLKFVISSLSGLGFQCSTVRIFYKIYSQTYLPYIFQILDILNLSSKNNQIIFIFKIKNTRFY